MKGEYHARTKSSLTGKKFWRHPAFERSRRSCSRFALANKIASNIYRSLPAEQRHYSIFCQLKTASIYLLKQELPVHTIEEKLRKSFLPAYAIAIKKRKVARQKKVLPYVLKVTSQYLVMRANRFLHLKDTMKEEALSLKVQQALQAVQLSPPLLSKLRLRA